MKKINEKREFVCKIDFGFWFDFKKNYRNT